MVKIKSINLAAAVMVVLFCAASLLMAMEVRNLSQYVDPIQGSGYVGPIVPFGAIQPGPECERGDIYGWQPIDQNNWRIWGIGQNHTSGTGWGNENYHWTIFARNGLTATDIPHFSQRENETMLCGYYGVTLKDANIKCEVTATHNAAIYKFTFPASTESYITIDFTTTYKNSDRVYLSIPRDMYTGKVYLDPTNKKVRGTGTFGGPTHPMSFSAQVSSAPTGFGVFKDSVLYSGRLADSVAATGHQLGCYFKFTTTVNQVIYLKLGESMISMDKADSYLASEIPAFDFEGTLARCRATWDTTLSKILIDDPTITISQLKSFYTWLYNCFIMPVDRSGDNPKWNGPFWDMQYCGWDTWRTEFPLMTIIKESFVSGNINCFIKRFYYQNTPKYIKDVFIWGSDAAGFRQGGDDVDPVIAEGYAKKIAGVNWDSAYAILKYHADNARVDAFRTNDRGWISVEDQGDNVSQTLEMNYNDFNAALVAKGLGKTADYNRYLTRSGQWENLFNPAKSDNGYSGFMQPKRRDLSWYDYDVNQFDESGKIRCCYEGNLWNYSYFVPHNMARLIERMGGNATFANRTNYYLNRNSSTWQQNHDWQNECGFLVSRTFNYALRPDLTALHARKGLPKAVGQDDGGAMSSFRLFTLMGFFPVAGQDVYLISGPMYKKFTIQMENGKNIVINGGSNANNTTTMYVSSVLLNGQPLNQSWFRHTEVNNGATLDFTMSATPSATWGQTGATPPPSGIEALTTPTESKPAKTKKGSSLSIDINQAKGVSIVLPGTQEYSLTLLNTQGQVVLLRTGSDVRKVTIDHNELSAMGVYVVNATCGENSMVKKFSYYR